jgi:quinohemoprotein ethanol dehydrogenase
MNQRLFRLALLFIPLALLACHGSAHHMPGMVDETRLAQSASEPNEWFTAGRDGDSSYHSPLRLIDAKNVGQLGFAWEYPLDTRRGLEATPIVVDGTMYVSAPFGHVYALDAISGTLRWHYDPEFDGQYGRYACCDSVNRGLAVWKGRVYVASLDGFLHAIDAATGQRIYKVDTLPARGPEHPYTITGAPVIAGDSVIIGSSGADFSGARGYVGAWDIKTGAARWRFYTVPHDPKQGPQEQAHLERAISSWDPRHDWSAGGGGNVWDGIAYDAKRGLVYVGTANGAPYDIKQEGRVGGDDLYAASILAIRAKDGSLAWHYQTTPGDAWDYDSTQKLVLADLTVKGKSRSVIMQASKNGFLYVLDRTTGEVLAAHNYVYVDWTLGIDPKTHRPRPNPAADYSRSPRFIAPGMAGGHNWQPMSYSPTTGLVYIPALEAPMVFLDSHKKGLIEGAFDVFGIFPEDYSPANLALLVGPLPTLDDLAKNSHATRRSIGVLRAVEPLTGKIVWEAPNATNWDGGVMSTDGNLVLQGDATGHLNVYSADQGHTLARIDVGTGILAAPMTYAVGGVQYVAVLAGYGGASGIAMPFPEQTAAAHYNNQGRVIAFRLGGPAVPKPPAVFVPPMPEPPHSTADARTIARGGDLYMKYCARCHTMGYGMLPDLRRLTPEKHAILGDIVLRGALSARGMGRFDDVLTEQDVAALSAFFIAEANRARVADTQHALPALAH